MEKNQARLYVRISFADLGGDRKDESILRRLPEDWSAKTAIEFLRQLDEAGFRAALSVGF